MTVGNYVNIDDSKRLYERNTIPDLNPEFKPTFDSIRYKNMLIIADRIQCVNRIKLKGLPSAFTSQDVEGMLYDKGAICAFEDVDKTLIFSSFTLRGKIMKKGKLYKIQPIGLDGKVYGAKKRVYTPDCGFEFDSDCCIIIKDYSTCIMNDTLIPRAEINMHTTIADEVKVYRQLVYNIIMSIKKIIVSGVSEEQSKVIEQNAKKLFDPSQPILTFSGKDITDFTSKYGVTQFADKLDVDTFTRAISFYNKTRRNFNGVPAPDTFEKKERMITPEMEDVGKGTNLILYDAYMQRKIAFDWINKAFGLNIEVEINNTILGDDSNGPVHTNLEVEGSDS